jgi:hypothetical protein
MDLYGRPKTALIIAMNGGIYLAITMDLYGRTKTTLTIALIGGL